MLKMTTTKDAKQHVSECRAILSELSFALQHGMTKEHEAVNEVTIYAMFERLQHAAWEGKHALSFVVGDFFRGR